MNDRERRLNAIEWSEAGDHTALADDLAAGWCEVRDAVLSRLNDPTLRRWIRQYLLLRLESAAASELAGSMLDYPEDFSAGRRDRSTGNLIAALDEGTLHERLLLLASSNAASALWDRIAANGSDAVMEATKQVLEHGETTTRETTLHLLVLDPYGPEYLPPAMQDQLLLLTLDDPDPEVRGLSAEVIAAEIPDELLARWDQAPLDAGERVRMAFWRAALMHRADQAIEAAGRIALDSDQALEARQTALLALGENVSTQTVAPVLQQLLRGDDPVLAEDAAQLMWRHHRRPDIANAAAESQFESVRELANRLLHPEMGSPAAGGSRPGDPTRTGEIFEQIRPDNERGG